jgi:hypothetical protein
MPGSSLQDSKHKLYAFFIYLMLATCLAHLILPDLTFGEEVEIKITIASSSFTFFQYSPNIMRVIKLNKVT